MHHVHEHARNTAQAMLSGTSLRGVGIPMTQCSDGLNHIRISFISKSGQLWPVVSLDASILCMGPDCSQMSLRYR